MENIFLNNLAENLFEFLVLAKNNIINENELIRNFPSPPPEVKSFLNEYPMPPSHIKVIIYLALVKSASISQISSTLGITKSNTTPIIDKLISYKLIERYNDSNDRRIVRAELTPFALSIFEKLKDAFKVKLINKLSVLDEPDLIRMDSCVTELNTIFMKIKEK